MRRQRYGPSRLLFRLCPILLTSVGLARANDVDRYFHDQYRGRTFVLRGFCSGEHLRYDAAGTIVGGRVGDWTIDGFVQLEQIRVSGQTLKIKAKRLMVVSAGQKGLRFAEEVSLMHEKLKTKPVNIEASLDRDSLSDGRVATVLSKIFLNPQDQIADLVPNYWRSCLLDGVSGKNENCRFSAEIAAVPGLVPTPRTAAVGAEPTSRPPSDATSKTFEGMTRIGNGVKPPKPIFQPEPSFSDPARKAKYQGHDDHGADRGQERTPKKTSIS